MIRPGLFHQISNFSKTKTLIALEFETPTGKQDLIRFEDRYGRSNKKYEGKEGFRNIKKPLVLKNLNKFKVQKFIINNIKLEFHNSKKILVSKKNNTIYSLIGGRIVNNRGKSVMPLGDIIKTGTLKKILSKFKVKNAISYIKLN